MSRKYYETLDRNHEIFRFFSNSDGEAVKYAKRLHSRSLVRINYKSLKILGVILPYKDEGYRPEDFTC